MRIFIPVLTMAFAVSTSAFALEMSDMDANADGVLSVEEFAAGHADANTETFAVIDANADGMIDPDEYKTATEEGGVLYES